jgi:two-component system, NtrC family, C4-dicarboxylate transport sensor histidine kinase DctB
LGVKPHAAIAICAIFRQFYPRSWSEGVNESRTFLWSFGLAIISAAICAAIFILAGHFATQNAVNGEAARVRAASVLLASSFRNELKRFGLALNILGQDPDLPNTLLNPNIQQVDRLNRKFEALAENMDGATVYLIDAKGTTVAASNWRSARSFVGRNYAFRTYHQQAMLLGRGQQFALGVISSKPGLHISERIEAKGRHLGVIVIKVLFESLEAEWRQSGKIAFATDKRGIILVTSKPEWRFQTTENLSKAQRADIRSTPDFGNAPMDMNALYAALAVGPVGTRAAYVRPYVDAVEPLPDGWKIHALASTEGLVKTANRNARLAAFAVLLLAAALFAIIYFRRRSAKARAELATSERLRLLNQRLMQTNRLATLGQIAAGVGHEINQPLAAIAAYADSGYKLITAGHAIEASENLMGIAKLTDRIGAITRELRGYARKSADGIGLIAVEPTITAALLLLRDRITSLNARIDFKATPEFYTAWAEPVRLEQVIVNLLQNALDAGDKGVVIKITIEKQGTMIEIVISDDGPGLTDAVRNVLFQPFSTSKTEGLGLGLVISRDIMAEFGGELVANRPLSGAEFAIRLKACA